MAFEQDCVIRLSLELAHGFMTQQGIAIGRSRSARLKSQSKGAVETRSLVRMHPPIASYSSSWKCLAVVVAPAIHAAALR